jgi:hypothetical protein
MPAYFLAVCLLQAAHELACHVLVRFDLVAAAREEVPGTGKDVRPVLRAGLANLVALAKRQALVGCEVPDPREMP